MAGHPAARHRSGGHLHDWSAIRPRPVRHRQRHLGSGAGRPAAMPGASCPTCVGGAGFFRHFDRSARTSFASNEGTFTAGGGARVWVSRARLRGRRGALRVGTAHARRRHGRRPVRPLTGAVVRRRSGRIPRMRASLSCVRAAARRGRAGCRRRREPPPLAEHYAPVVFQESRSTVLDFITKFDYDGDWKGDNNWRNAYLYDLPGHVYYSVIESTSHYFITYAFYHARDYTARPYEGFAPKTEHENDMEGLHGHDREGRDALRQGGAARDAGPRRLLQVRQPRQPPGVGRQPQARWLDDVRGRPARGLRRGRRARREGGEPRRRGFGQLVPGHRLPLHGAGRRCRESNRDPKATYDLVSIEDTLWARRFDVGSTFCCADPYVMTDGRTANAGQRVQRTDRRLRRQTAVGMGPGERQDRQGRLVPRSAARPIPTQVRIQNFTGTYVHNPYLESDGRNAGQPCAESATQQDGEGRAGVEPARHRPRHHRSRA